MDRITVVMTCYREGDLLRRAYASLEAQSDRDFELVVVNDAAPDPLTNAICREWEHEKRARVLWRTTNGGPAVAKNYGAEAATGEICVCLDGDDVLPPTAIQAIRTGFQKAPEADFVFGNYLRRDLPQQTERVVDCGKLCGPDGYLDGKRLCRQDWVLLGTSPCRKRAWLRVGGHATEFGRDAHDVVFFMRLVKAGCRGFYVNEVIYEWNRSATGTNSNATADTWRQVNLANLDLFDAFGEGKAVREQLFWSSVKRRDFALAQTLARQLMRHPGRSPTVLLAAYLPLPVLTGLYRLRHPAGRHE